ncbi:MAG: dephospho-CoA kinase [Desulfovibrionaceae bacterium]|nr:dephospho-CoA kinase [Desulfovibrionaceae bacterium]
MDGREERNGRARAPGSGTAGGRYVVGSGDHGVRLDAFASRASGLSRSRVKKAVLAGLCRVNGRVCTEADVRLDGGSLVELEPGSVEAGLTPEEGELAVLYRDESVVVVDKPAGLTVHPCPSCPEGTLVQRLLAHFPELARQEGARPGIVHRLDKDTSGLLVAALTESARLALSSSFVARAVAKTYLALTRGVPEAEGRVTLPLGRHPTLKTRMAVVPENRGGRSASSSWRRLYADPAGRFAVLAVSIHTGRTHQIRVHLAEAGHPLWGDRLYAPRDSHDPAPRQMLHAWKLTFPHPARPGGLTCVCPPPEDFTRAALELARRTQRVVLTGTPGCGKSSVLRLLAAEGVPVWSADAVVARLYRPGEDGWLLLRRRWGSRFLQGEDGPVDHAALAAALMADAGLRRELEQLIHPLVFADMERFFSRAEADGHRRAVAEVPLWHESRRRAQGLAPDMVAVTVACPADARHARLREGRGWSGERAQAVDAWQWPERDKIAASHYVLDNGGPVEDLPGRVRTLLKLLDERRAAAGAALADTLRAVWGDRASVRACSAVSEDKGVLP